MFKLALTSSKIDIRLADSTPGWMSHQELEWLATQALTHERIVEIGSYLGRSTVAIAENTKGVVYAVDNFLGPQDIGVSQVIRDNLFELFCYYTGSFINSGRVIPVLSDHSLASGYIAMTPDMVFLDGSHEYKDVKRDIEIWLPRLPKGSLLCGHDYTNMVGVRDAVDELIPNAKLAKDTSIWYVQL